MAKKGPPTHPLPSYQEEDALWAKGYELVAGLDEVGRGPLAGPVLAGVAILPPRLSPKWVGLVRDSKQLTANQREQVLPYLKEHAIALEVGISSAREVDELGIGPATRLAMTRAVNSLPFTPQFLLVDAIPFPELQVPHKSIVRGDALCVSIAAASIIAKVVRDKIMAEKDSVYPKYGFARNKGYATQEHLDALRNLGPCPIHRFSFAPVRDHLAASR